MFIVKEGQFEVTRMRKDKVESTATNDESKLRRLLGPQKKELTDKGSRPKPGGAGLGKPKALKTKPHVVRLATVCAG